MCIESSVGKSCANLRKDVIIIQCALNYFSRGVPFRNVPISGKCDDDTINGIIDFQTRIQKMPKPDGKIASNGNTIKSLYDKIPSSLDFFSLRAIMVSSNQMTIDKFSKHVVTMMETRSINMPLRRAHFLAQLGHESSSFLYTEEIASGIGYENRADLGNTENGDGKRFKGRGLIQLTGRANYKSYGSSIGQDLTVNGNWTKVSTDPVLAVDAAGWFWETHNLNEIADTDDINKVTRIVNGGLNGLADRKDYLKRAKWFLVYP